MKYEFSLANGTFTEGGAGVTQTGTRNDTALHFIYAEFAQAASGTLTIEYKGRGTSNWAFVGRVDLTSSDVAFFKLPEYTVSYRFIVEGASGDGIIQIVDSPREQQPGINSVSINNAVVLTETRYGEITPADDVLYITTSS